MSQVLILRYSDPFSSFSLLGILFQSQRLVCELPKWHLQDQLCLSFSFCKFVYSASQINLCKMNSWFSLSPQSAPPEALPISSDGNSVLLSVHMLEHSFSFFTSNPSEILFAYIQNTSRSEHFSPSQPLPLGLFYHHLLLAAIFPLFFYSVTCCPTFSFWQRSQIFFSF